MKRLITAVCATLLLAATCSAQENSQTPKATMSTQEFRQVLVDLGSYLDAHKGTHLAEKFAALPENSLEMVLPAVADPWGLQRSVSALKESDMAGGAGFGSRPNVRNQYAVRPDAAFPSCSPDTIIDNSSGALCTPAYPDPTNTAWQSLVNPLITFGAFSPTDYPDVAGQVCSLTVNSNLSTVVSALQGTVEALTPACSIIPPIVNAACWGPAIALAAADATSQGLFSDCTTQNGYVGAAETDAAFHNTVTIYDSLNSVNNQITGEFNNLSTQVSGVSSQVTTVSNNITNDFAALNANLTAYFNALTTQLTNANAQQSAELKQVMKLLLTPDGKKAINPQILTCTGTNCPNVLAKCPAAGCSWNNVGPLP